MKSEKIFQWFIRVICGFLALVFVGLGGITKLVGMEFQRETFLHYDYPIWFMYFVGSIELILGVLVLISRTRFLSACGMIVITLGVIASSARIGELSIGLLYSPAAIVMALAVLLAIFDNPIRTRK